MAKQKGNEEETQYMIVNGMSFSSKSCIVTDDGVYSIDLMPDLETIDDLSDRVAYLDGDYFYLYRGIGNPDLTENKKPGIYRNRKTSPKFFIIDPRTEKEKEEYNSIKNVSTLCKASIIDSANNKEDLLIAIPESTKIFQPQISENDDILKLLAKKVILKKNIDLDMYKDRFANKNELFNFKQVIRGDNKLSMKIFDRGVEALNVKYTITVEEKGNGDVVGEPLTEPVSVCSEDSYAA